MCEHLTNVMDQRLKEMFGLARSWRFWIVVAALLGLPMLYVASSSPTDVILVPWGMRPTEFRDLWESHPDWDDGKSIVPPAAGPTSRQLEVIDNFERAWIAATEDNYSSQGWHGSDILGFREITHSNDKNELRRALKDFKSQARISADLGIPEAFAAEIGLRLQHGQQYLDVSVSREREARGVAWFHDSESTVVMLFPKSTTLRGVLARLRKGLPKGRSR